MSHPIDIPLAPTCADVAARHPELPGMAAVLDPERRAALLTPLLGEAAARDVRIERLRLKAHTSLTAALREPLPRAGAGAQRWWRLRAFAPHSFEDKATKERRAAHRNGRPALLDPELRVSVIPAETDRHMPLLEQLRPDTGALVCLPGAARDLGPRWLRTLSYNPDRRWVGVTHTPEGTPRELLRLYAGVDDVEVRPWTPGRPWTRQDSHDRELLELLAQTLTDALARASAADDGTDDGGDAGRKDGTDDGAERRTEFAERLGVAATLRGAVTALADIDPDLAQRAEFLTETLAPQLAAAPLAPAHGDFTTDQVVVDAGRPGVLDWDRHGLWPLGWDAATWHAGQVRDGVRAGEVQPLPGVDAPSPAVRAAALLAYAPDPFRRQLPEWGARTRDLVASAEEVLA